MMAIINPKAFLQLGGGVLLLVAVLGYVGIIGPTPEQSLFGMFWYFDNAENIAHFVLGVVAIASVFVLSSELQKPLVIVVGFVALLAGLASLFGVPSVFGAGLENPADTILHLFVAAWALWAGFGGSAKAGSMGM